MQSEAPKRAGAGHSSSAKDHLRVSEALGGAQGHISHFAQRHTASAAYSIAPVEQSGWGRAQAYGLARRSRRACGLCAL